jgi:FAD/FMN-containing dehydrogenase
VRATGAADAVAAVRFAREHGLPLSIRGGGHNVAGNAVADGALMLDQSGLKGIHVDPGARVARVQPGVLWGELDREAQLFGQAVPGGIHSLTGVAGLTLGGGFGWLSRKYGLTSDSLLSVDMVTAEGEPITVSERQHPDLFWAVRGGGGNFGAVTSFEFRTHPVGPTVTAGLLFYPQAEAAAVFDLYRSHAESAPDDLSLLYFLRNAPASPALPSAMHGKPVAGIAACYLGSPEAAAPWLDPLRRGVKPLADLVGPKPFSLFQTTFDAASPPGRRYYWKSEYFGALPDELGATLARHAGQPSSPLTAMLLFRLGGAIRRAGPDAPAAGLRDADHILNIQAQWADAQEDERHHAWAQEFWQAVRPFGTGEVYVNFVSAGEGDDRARAAYGRNYGRLADLKRRYDPGNLFSANQNIRPAG